jgi:hypothetical protein
VGTLTLIGRLTFLLQFYFSPGEAGGFLSLAVVSRPGKEKLYLCGLCASVVKALQHYI